MDAKIMAADLCEQINISLCPPDDLAVDAFLMLDCLAMAGLVLRPSENNEATNSYFDAIAPNRKK